MASNSKNVAADAFILLPSLSFVSRQLHVSIHASVRTDRLVKLLGAVRSYTRLISRLLTSEGGKNRL